MSELVMHCISEPDANAADTADDVAAYLSSLDGADPVLVEVEQPRLGLAEILIIVQVGNAAVGLAEKLIGYLKSRHGRVKDIEVEINGRRVSIAQLTPEERSELVAILANET